MRKTTLHYVTLLLISALLGACASLKDRVDLLETTQRNYQSALRWGQMDSVYAMHRNPDGSMPNPDPRINNYKVTTIQVLSSSIAADKVNADQLMEIKYYHADYMRESTLTLQLHWRFDEPSHNWLLTSPPPEFE